MLLNPLFRVCLVILLVYSFDCFAGDDIPTQYNQRCSFCHDTAYTLAPRRGVPYDWVERLQFGPEVIALRSLSGIGRMPPKGGSLDLSNEEYLDIANYLLSTVVSQ